MDALSIKNSLKSYASSYSPESVEGFDVATGLPRLREAFFSEEWEGCKNPFNTVIQREEL